MLEVGVAEAELLRLVAAQVREDASDTRTRSSRTAARLGLAEVERERALVAVEALEEERVLALLVRRDVARDVAADGRVLDLDHLGAEVGELHRPERAGAVLLDRDDADVGERPRHSSVLAAPGPPPAVTSASAPGRNGEMSIS